ncbi:MAG: YadA-like family protein [Aquabacterium sp.]
MHTTCASFGSNAAARLASHQARPRWHALHASLLSAGVLSLGLTATPVQAGPANPKPVAPVPVTPSKTQFAGLTSQAKCSGQYTNAINASTNASLGLQIGGVAAQVVAITADGVGLALEAAGATTFATPALIPGIAAQGVALAANLVALGTVSAALSSDLANAILSQEGAKLPQCDTLFAGTVEVTNGGLIAAGNSHFRNSLGVEENVNVGGVVRTTNLVATNTISADIMGANTIYSQGIVNDGHLTTTDLTITGQLNAAGLSVTKFVAQGDMATVGIVNSGRIATDSLSVTGQSLTSGIVNTGSMITTTLATTAGAVIGTTLSVGTHATVAGNLEVGGSLSAGTAFQARADGAFMAHGDRRVVVDGNSAQLLSGANRVTVSASGAEMAGAGAHMALSGSHASIVNATGHGMVVSADRTLLSGGTSSTTLQLDDAGARFADSTTGGPARVTGVADATAPNDAVNLGQLRLQDRKMSSGIASVAAMANIPPLEQGKTVALGIGVGHFNGMASLAIAGSLRVSPNASFRASVATNGSRKNVVGAGASLSW